MHYSMYIYVLYTVHWAQGLGILKQFSSSTQFEFIKKVRLNVWLRYKSLTPGGGGGEAIYPYARQPNSDLRSPFVNNSIFFFAVLEYDQNLNLALELDKLA